MYNLIKNKPKQFAVLVLLQLIVVLSLVSVTGYAHIQILEEVSQIIEPLQNLNLDINKIEQGVPLIEDETVLFNHYKNILFIIYALIAGVALIWLTLNWWLWNQSKKFLNLVKGKWKYFAVSSLIIGLLVLIVVYYLGKEVLIKGTQTQAAPAELYWLLLILAACYYVMLSVIKAADGKTWKSFQSNFVKIVSDTKHLTRYVFMLLLYIVGLYLFTSFVMVLPIIGIIIAICLLFVLIWGKLYWLQKF